MHYQNEAIKSQMSLSYWWSYRKLLVVNFSNFMTLVSEKKQPNELIFFF